ncbi:hypothetical protein PAAG_04649 [Paracoccidioides lutzii Pb01]|uniref:Uncharacterized protein n=1 Tax=Paracoccidioides lutzii (strain ATCC MYA-826 / Pb01) TaxID=502779 RepID=C1H1K5_PARBA|nr:hypothetical protein PAAG_04649 [Paracoccidioides lutzii Pb01]EEH33599.1 hypothetical protein PAAG_04649 [Paracoccidioides lutzii Pb01]
MDLVLYNPDEVLNTPTYSFMLLLPQALLMDLSYTLQTPKNVRQSELQSSKIKQLHQKSWIKIHSFHACTQKQLVMNYSLDADYCPLYSAGKSKRNYFPSNYPHRCMLSLSSTPRSGHEAPRGTLEGLDFCKINALDEKHVRQAVEYFFSWSALALHMTFRYTPQHAYCIGRPSRAKISKIQRELLTKPDIEEIQKDMKDGGLRSSELQYSGSYYHASISNKEELTR